MFSNITEAWSYDPVKEITDKLSKGAFRTNAEQNEIFKFKNLKDSNKNDSKNDSKNNSKDISNLSDIDSLSLLSENTLASNTIMNSDYGSFAPINFNKYQKKSHHGKNKIITDDSDSNSDSNLNFFSESEHESRCNYSVKHLKKCDKCYFKLKKLVNSQVHKKVDEIILENKMKQLQETMTLPKTQNSFPSGQTMTTQLIPYTQNNSTSESWKETLIIVIGAIIAIFIIFLVAKSINK